MFREKQDPDYYQLQIGEKHTFGVPFIIYIVPFIHTKAIAQL